MVFKRRDRLSVWQTVKGWFWPRRGWTRSFHYVRHRVSRLPDPPHRIARGVAIGVFVSFSPAFGIHILTAILLSMLIRANLIAALLATFFGNPITYPFIAIGSSKLGHWMLGSRFNEGQARSFGHSFMDAWRDVMHNLAAMFTGAPAQWGALAGFFREVFLPYLLGGTVLGVIAGVIAYYLTLPVISAYQHRRRLRLKDRLEALRAKIAAKKAEDRHEKP